MSSPHRAPASQTMTHPMTHHILPHYIHPLRCAANARPLSMSDGEDVGAVADLFPCIHADVGAGHRQHILGEEVGKVAAACR